MLAPTDFDLVCFSHLRWNFVYQRPQHLLSRFARHQRVFYIEEPIFERGAAHLEVQQESDCLWIITPHIADDLSTEAYYELHRRLLDELFVSHRIGRYVLWYYNPMAYGFSSHLHPLAIVYDCMDELSAFRGAPTTMSLREQQLFAVANLVFTGCQSLYEAKRAQHPHVHRFPSSVDQAHFAQARQQLDEPADQAAINGPLLGFYGVIDERIDLGLLAAIADARPDWQYVLLGPVVKIDPATLPQRENLHYLGSKAYADLPRYLARWDLALLPFARNEATRFISPTKTLEYLAGGKTVLSTSIRDVVHPYGEKGLVLIADDPADFVATAEKVMQGEITICQQEVAAFLAQTSWDTTWGEMQRLIEDAVLQKQS